MPHASATDFKRRYDERRLGQLVKDDGTQASSSALDSDTILSEMLDDATSMVNSHVLRGNRYTAEDLAALTGSDAKLLVRLTCDLAYGLLVQRRGFSAQELASLAPAYDRALQTLQQLADGVLVFNVEAVRAAGRPKRAVIDKNLQLISSTRRLYGNLTVNVNNPGNPTDFGD